MCTLRLASAHRPAPHRPSPLARASVDTAITDPQPRPLVRPLHQPCLDGIHLDVAQHRLKFPLVPIRRSKYEGCQRGPRQPAALAWCVENDLKSWSQVTSPTPPLAKGRWPGAAWSTAWKTLSGFEYAAGSSRMRL